MSRPNPALIAGVATSVITDWNGSPVTMSMSGRPFERRYADATRLAIFFGRSSGDAKHNPIGSVLRDPDKKALAAQLIGQAYVAAYNLVRANRDQIEAIADVLVERKELYGDELVELLENANLRRPEIDYMDEASWPRQ